MKKENKNKEKLKKNKKGKTSKFVEIEEITTVMGRGLIAWNRSTGNNGEEK